MGEKMIVAGVQMDVAIGEVEKNVARVESFAREAASSGARLVVFPECALTGYCFPNLDEARPFAVSTQGPVIERLIGVCRVTDAFLAVGTLEADGSNVYNASLVIGPTGLVGVYRKTHLPFLGVDRFTTPGKEPPRVWQVGPVRLGMNICYDGSFPECSRVMALAGADLIALPTNWPPAAENFARYVINARAMENNVYYMSVNRVGEERGFSFIGLSRICDPFGNTLAEANHNREAILLAEIDTAFARRKRQVRIAGEHEIDRIHDRRPDLYGALVEPVKKPGGTP